MLHEKYLAALAVALPLALAGAGSWMAHRDAERAAAVRLADLTAAMQEQAERAFAANDMVFRELQRASLRGAALHELLGAISERLPHIRSIAIRDADGAMLVSSDGAEDPGFRLSEPRRGGGTIELALEPAYFRDLYSRLAKPADEVRLRIAAGDGRVLARWPDEAGMQAVEETYSASRAVGAYPLFVSATQSPHAVLAPWRYRTTIVSAIALPSAAAVLYVSLLVLGRTRRLQEEARSRRHAEERLRHSQKMDALGELTGGVAHDFGNLMAVISNAAHVLRVKSGAESPELAAIHRAIDSGTRLTRQLLTFARRQPLEPARVDLQNALPGMADLLKSTVGSCVSLGIHIAPDTPAVFVDRAELEMALINLAANARDAMQRAGELEILARAGEPGEGPERGTRYAIVSVSDSGAGIPPEIRARVFEPFFTTKPEGSGTGLGLAQVYGFCEQAGGGVQLESDVGVGTTVSLFLPAAARMSEAVVRERRPQAIRLA
jgi:two-component system NtrC family sensor kinase